jgi:transposase InsO family protein
VSHEGVDKTVFMYGFVTGYARSAMNIEDITHHKDRAIIEHRIKVLNFFDCYGAIATKEAFGFSRSTVYLWKQTLKANNGRISCLAPNSKAPLNRRRRSTNPIIADFIVTQRERHPRLSKAKLATLLTPVCSKANLNCPSVSTVGRILSDLKAQGRLPKYEGLSLNGRTGRMYLKRHQSNLAKERRGSYHPEQAGDLVQLDCVIKFVNGMRRYVISAIDYNSEFAFSMGYSSLSSARAQDFLHKFLQVAPFEVKRVQTDNGSEFYKLFHEACIDLELTHYWNYPRHPKMNAKIERYNRTVQEEFVDWHLDDLGYDIASFNYQLMDWVLWYNTERPHFTLELKSPMRAWLDSLQLPLAESNMLWTNT